MREQNIFYNIVNNENNTTELLCNLLQFKAFRISILELFLERDAIDKIEYEHCDTQNILPESNGRPDLVIHNDHLEIIMEIKIGDANLTSSQPISYLNHLNKSSQKNRWLILLIPNEYIHIDAWNNLCADYLKKNPDSNIKMRIIFWQEVINKLEQYDFFHISKYLQDFVLLLKQWFERKLINFLYSEVKLMFTEQIPTVITKLFKVVDEVKYEIEREFGESIIIRRSFKSDEFVLYIKNEKNLEFLFFGIWYEYWETSGHPICYGVGDVYKPEVINSFQLLHEKNINSLDGWLCTWIPEILFEKNNCEKEISTIIITEIRNLLPLLDS